VSITVPKVQRLRELQPLLDQAIQEKKWFFCNYQQMWISPKEIVEYWGNNRFLWEASNWKLRDPQERLEEILARISGLNKEIVSIKSRIEEG
jgi:hypothetical protein